MLASQRRGSSRHIRAVSVQYQSDGKSKFPVGTLASVEPDDDDALGASGVPPGPAERSWLHPSEFGKLMHPSGGSAAARPRPAATRDRSPLAVALVSGMVGAALVLGVVALTGNLRPTVKDRIVTQVQSGRNGSNSDPDAVASIAADTSDSVLAVHADGPSGVHNGSAVAYRSDGHLITNHRLVADASSIDVIGRDGTAHDARVVGSDADTDVAVLVVEGARPPVATMGHVGNLRVGQLAVVVGGSLEPGGGPTVSAGVIARLGQAIPTGASILYDMIATNAVADQWLTGGALVGRDGSLVGIALVPDPGQPALAVPIDVARRVADEILDRGHVEHAWLGIQTVDLDAHTAADFGVTAGALVRAIASGSPAQKAGMDVQDVVTSIDGDRINNSAAMVTVLRRREPGQTVSVGYVRAGRARTAKMVLADRPAK